MNEKLAVELFERSCLSGGEPKACVNLETIYRDGLPAAQIAADKNQEKKYATLTAEIMKQRAEEYAMFMPPSES